MRKRKSRMAGFTIIEIIILLVIMGFIGWMVGPFFFSGVMTSSEPLDNLELAADFNSVMANMVADYDDNHSTEAELDTFHDSIGSIGLTYNDPDYGYYTVVRNEYITVIGTASTASSSWLIVTIENPNNPGETLTNLFTVY